MQVPKGRGQVSGGASVPFFGMATRRTCSMETSKNSKVEFGIKSDQWWVVIVYSTIKECLLTFMREKHHIL